MPIVSSNNESEIPAKKTKNKQNWAGSEKFSLVQMDIDSSMLNLLISTMLLLVSKQFFSWFTSFGVLEVVRLLVC